MPSRTILNIVIFFAVIVLGVLAFYPGEQNEQHKPGVRLTSLNKADIQFLAIHGLSETTVQFNKQQSGWYMSKPVHAKASEHRINTLLDVVEQTSHSQYQVPKDNLAKYGLAQPKYTLEFNNHLIAIGQNEPIKQRRYVLFENTVHIIDDFFSHLFSQSPATLIDHALLPMDSVIVKIVLPQYEINKVDSQWQVTPSEGKAYSQDVLQTLVDEWRYGRALQMSLLTTAQTSTNTAKILQVYLQNQASPVVFHVENTPQQILFIRPDLMLRYHLTPNSAQRLLRIPDINPTSN